MASTKHLGEGREGGAIRPGRTIRNSLARGYRHSTIRAQRAFNCSLEAGRPVVSYNGYQQNHGQPQQTNPEARHHGEHKPQSDSTGKSHPPSASYFQDHSCAFLPGTPSHLAQGLPTDLRAEVEKELNLACTLEQEIKPIQWLTKTLAQGREDRPV